jgi:hypothetical protein
MATPQLPKGFDFTDPDVYAARLPTEELRELRRAAPIWWNEQPSGVGGFTDAGTGWSASIVTYVRCHGATMCSPARRTASSRVQRNQALAGGLHRRLPGAIRRNLIS